MFEVGLAHFVAEAGGAGGGEEAGVGGAGDDFDDGVAAELLEGLAEEADGAFEVEGVKLAGDDVKFAGQGRGKLGPVALDFQVDVVGFPGFGRHRVDAAGAAVPKLAGQAVGVQRAEHGFEGAKLTATAQYVVHFAERIVPQNRRAAAAGDGPALALFVNVKAERRIGVKVDLLIIAEIDRVGRGAPHAAEGVGVSDLQPQARPTAGTMPIHKASRRLGHGAKRAVDQRNHFLHQGIASRAVGGTVGIHMMAPFALPAKHHPNEIDFARCGLRGLTISQPLPMTAAETGNHIHHGEAFLLVGKIGFGQHHGGPFLHFSLMELGKEFAVQHHFVQMIDLGKIFSADHLATSKAHRENPPPSRPPHAAGRGRSLSRRAGKTVRG